MRKLDDVYYPQNQEYMDLGIVEENLKNSNNSNHSRCVYFSKSVLGGCAQDLADVLHHEYQGLTSLRDDQLNRVVLQRHLQGG